MTFHPKGRMLVIAVLLAFGLTACSATYTNHGYTPPAEDLANILPGLDTRESVEETIGQPSAAGLMEENIWFYVASRQRHFTYHAAEVVEREIVAISFDDRGVVENIREMGLEDGQIVHFSRRVTETNIQEVTFLRQLARNFGRIDVVEALSGGG